jgi:hypothetical protein
MTRISPIVADWAVQHGGGTIKTQSQNGRSLWPLKAVGIATFEGRRLDAAISRTSLDEGGSPQCSPPSMPSTERHGGEIVIRDCSETLSMGVMKRCGLEQKEDFEMNRSSILKILNAWFDATSMVLTIVVLLSIYSIIPERSARETRREVYMYSELHIVKV